MNNNIGDWFQLIKFMHKSDFWSQQTAQNIPRAQMTPVLIEKRPCFGGVYRSTFKNRAHLGSRYRLGNGGFPIFCGREPPCQTQLLGGAICGSIGLEGSDL